MFDATLSAPTSHAQGNMVCQDYADRPRIPSGTASCAGCARRHACMVGALDGTDVEKLAGFVHSTRVIRQAETLLRAGDAFRSIYAVRTGSFKTVIVHRDGMEHVSGFQFPGDIIGLDGLHANHYEVSAMALEDSTVCVMPFSVLEKQCRERWALQHQIYTLMSAEIVRESGLMMLLGVMSARERVAAFLINISTRMQQRGFSASLFNLRMTRDEIGSYLGITLETVSRTMSRLQKDGLIHTDGKQVRILDMEGLHAV